MTTEAEQNRLIIDNMGLVPRIAATFHHKKIPQEELEAEARAALVNAARKWRPYCGWKFSTFAIEGINYALINFTRKWERLESVGRVAEEEIERLWYEWSKFFVVPYETWTSLAATPEELVLGYEEMRAGLQALSGAMIGLNKRERDMIRARFIDTPNKTLNHIAQDHRVSYARTVYIIKRALGKLAGVLNNLENKKATAA